MSNIKSTRTGWITSFLLFVVFLVLKLTDTIDWSWSWVTSPLWIYTYWYALDFLIDNQNHSKTSSDGRTKNLRSNILNNNTV